MAWIVNVVWVLACFATAQNNMVVSPHGLGRFYQEPSGYRPSLQGAEKMIASFQGLHLIQDCFDEKEVPKLFTGVLSLHHPSPALGFQGPDDYPQVEFSFQSTENAQLKLRATVFLFLPEDLLPDQKPQKVLAFEYRHQHSIVHQSCKEDIKLLIESVIQTWMAEYARYNLG